MSRDNSSHLNVSLVDRHRLDFGPGPSQDGHDHHRLGFVFIHSRWNEHAFGTESTRRYAGHGRAHSELPSLVTRRADDATLGWRAADDYRLATKGRIIPLLH